MTETTKKIDDKLREELESEDFKHNSGSFDWGGHLPDEIVERWSEIPLWIKAGLREMGEELADNASDGFERGLCD